MIYFSNSKINIGLNVLEKRADGFHNIVSAMAPIPLYDIIEIVPQTIGFEYLQTGLLIDCELEKNTCYVAYQLLKKHFPIISNCRIHLHKFVPTGMGLGGGSANAVGVLKAFDALYKLKISQALYFELAEQIGSDCAFFVDNKSSLINGKGNEIESINLDLYAYQLLVLLPKHISVNTQWAYSSIIPKQPEQALSINIKKSVADWKQCITNDFEAAVFKKFAVLKNAKNYLYKLGASYASMSGSGASIYGLFEKGKSLDLSFFEADFNFKIMSL